MTVLTLTQHSALTGASLHAPGAHKTQHESGGSDEVALATTQITGLAEFIRDTIGSALTAGSNVTLTVNDAGDTITIAATGGGGSLAVEANDVSVSASVSTLDFSTSFSVAESPAGEANVDTVTDQLDLVQTYRPDQSSALSAGGANTVYFVRLRVQKAIAVTKMACIGTAGAGGNVDMAIGTVSGTTFTRVDHTGVQAFAGTAALQEFSLVGGSLTLVPGTDYYFAIGVDSATPTFLRVAMQGVWCGLKSQALVKASGWSTGIPSSLLTLAAGSSMPWIAAYS